MGVVPSIKMPPKTNSFRQMSKKEIKKLKELGYPEELLKKF
tara:strand:- start:505 stop:627 length:123 start_codon:yes stop_codon:yes gene_type:complete